MHVPRNNDAYDALAGARHPDPFSLLGPHVEDGAVVIRAFQPSAEKVEVLHEGGPTEMPRVHGGGAFEASFPATEIFDSHLRVTSPGGAAVEMHHCPFHQVAQQHSDVVCGLHLGLMQGAFTQLGSATHATRLEPFATPRMCLAHLGVGPPADRVGAA